MIEERTSVQLNRDLPDEDLREGDLGVVFHVCRGGEAYEVKLMTFSGETVAIRTLESASVEPLDDRVIPPVRRRGSRWHRVG